MKKVSLIFLFAFIAFAGKAQEKLAVLNFDIVGKSLTKQQYISITRAEIAKLNLHQVLDKYTIQETLEKNPVDWASCFGTNCLSDVGQKLNVKYVVAGSAEVINDKAIISLRLIDATTGQAIKNSYSEFYWSEENAQRLIQLAVFKLFDQPIDEKKLAIFDYDKAKRGALEGPEILEYNLSGPRFGGVYQTGEMGNILKRSTTEGGFDKSAFMSVIGYQFEKQYLYTGPFQAVFQVNFSLTGLDQQLAVPSMTILNGFRTTKGGWEFGFGPSFRIKRTAEGFYRNNADGSRTWHLSGEAEPYEDPSKTRRLDSRGDIKLISSWVWGIGKSFKAGSMNIPINFYTIPDKDGWLFGLSMGYAIHM